jgi:poly-gamma-glutamate synthesis protein (capsule biosynthesis protein)
MPSMPRMPWIAVTLLLGACVAGTGSEQADTATAPVCVEPDSLVIGAVGDLLLHSPLQRQAYASPDGFASLWAPLAPALTAPDITYANLEGAVADGLDERGRAVADPGPVFDDRVYTSYPLFNYHASLIDDLLASGIDVVSTANNHSLDRFAEGARRTIDNLEARGLPFTGTRRDAADPRSWATVLPGAITTAWLACTYGTNGIIDREDQVLLCFEDEAEVLATVRALDADPAVDAVIVTPHWGLEYRAEPSDDQRRLASAMVNAGAIAVIGAHPHVLQPWQPARTPDGRAALIHYSLGNFVSNQAELPRRATMVLALGLTREGVDGPVSVAGYGYVPAIMTRGADRVIYPAEAAPGGQGAALAHIASLGFSAARALPADGDGWRPALGLAPQCAAEPGTVG